MPRTYHARATQNADQTVTVEIGFGEAATNAEIVTDAVAAIEELHLTGGPGIKFSGPASLPVAFALAHAVAHLYGYVACYDPKLRRYVIAISHDPAHRPGGLID